MLKAISDWLEAAHHVKGEWKCATTMHGEQSVMITLTQIMLQHKLHVDSFIQDTRMLVTITIVLCIAFGAEVLDTYC